MKIMKKVTKKLRQKVTLVNTIVIVLSVALVVGIFLLSVAKLGSRSIEARGENLYSNLLADLKTNQATFNFDYSGTVLYKDLALYYLVDTSIGGKFTNSEWKSKDWVILGISANTSPGTPPPLPIVVYDPKSIWDKYNCGSLIYWRVRAVVTKNVVNTSPIQQAVVDCSTTSTTTP